MTRRLASQAARVTLRAVESIFRAPWDSLTLDDVRAFFADAGDEGVRLGVPG